MEHVRLVDILYLHGELIAESGGSQGLRDRRLLESALAQPFATFGRVALYPDVTDKAAALCYFLTQNHPFVDGNKRVGYAAMRLMFEINEWTFEVEIDEAEDIMLRLAGGEFNREEFTTWVKEHARPVDTSRGS